MSKKIFALLLSLMMVFALIPGFANADGGNVIYLKGSGNSFDAAGWKNIFFMNDGDVGEIPSVWHLVIGGNKDLAEDITYMHLVFTNGVEFEWFPSDGFSSNGGDNNPGWVIVAPYDWELDYIDSGNNNESDCYFVINDADPQFNVSGFSAGKQPDAEIVKVWLDKDGEEIDKPDDVEAYFNVYDENENLVLEEVTAGKHALKPGIYTIVELEKDGFSATNTEWTLVVEAGKTATFTCINQEGGKLSAVVAIAKYLENFGEAPDEEFEFWIYNEAGDAFGPMVYEGNGNYSYDFGDDTELGNYSIIEEKADGFVAADALNFSIVEENGVAVVVFDKDADDNDIDFIINKYERGNLKIYKDLGRKASYPGTITGGYCQDCFTYSFDKKNSIDRNHVHNLDSVLAEKNPNWFEFNVLPNGAGIETFDLVTGDKLTKVGEYTIAIDAEGNFSITFNDLMAAYGAHLSISNTIKYAKNKNDNNFDANNIWTSTPGQQQFQFSGASFSGNASWLDTSKPIYVFLHIGDKLEGYENTFEATGAEIFQFSIIGPEFPDGFEFEIPANGSYEFKDIRVGDYTITELTKGWVATYSVEDGKVTVVANETAEVRVKNEPGGGLSAKVEIMKFLGEWGGPIDEEFEFTVYALDGTEIGLMEYEGDGVYSYDFGTEAVVGRYYIVETKADGYAEADTLYFEIDADGNTIFGKDNNGDDIDYIINYPITGTLILEKTIDGTPFAKWNYEGNIGDLIAGMVFTLYKASGNGGVIYESTPITTGSLDINGTITFTYPGEITGWYAIVETFTGDAAGIFDNIAPLYVNIKGQGMVTTNSFDYTAGYTVVNNYASNRFVLGYDGLTDRGNIFYIGITSMVTGKQYDAFCAWPASSNFAGSSAWSPGCTGHYEVTDPSTSPNQFVVADMIAALNYINDKYDGLKPDSESKVNPLPAGNNRRLTQVVLWALLGHIKIDSVEFAATYLTADEKAAVKDVIENSVGYVSEGGIVDIVYVSCTEHGNNYTHCQPLLVPIYDNGVIGNTLKTAE